MLEPRALTWNLLSLSLCARRSSAVEGCSGWVRFTGTGAAQAFPPSPFTGTSRLIATPRFRSGHCQRAEETGCVVLPLLVLVCGSATHPVGVLVPVGWLNRTQHAVVQLLSVGPGRRGSPPRRDPCRVPPRLAALSRLEHRRPFDRRITGGRLTPRPAPAPPRPPGHDPCSSEAAGRM